MAKKSGAAAAKAAGAGFDPGAAAAPGAGVFGLPCTREESRVVLLPVPFDATTSYKPGTAKGPEAVFEASMQVDLFDRRLGRVYERGIWWNEAGNKARAWSREAAVAARPIIAAGGADSSNARHRAACAKVDAACAKVNALVERETRAVLEEGKIPGLVGGEHSVPFGAIRAVAQKHPGVGILHLDAHMDFREAFEGFAWSHASIMHNVMSRVDGVGKLVQVGIRDFSEAEMEFALSQGDRVVVHYDDAWAEEMMRGRSFAELAQRAIGALPREVYVSFDIDALEPALCPNTGTPVPGGLTFHQAAMMLEMVVKSGRRVVGFDVVEVAPGMKGGPEIDAVCGARALYKLCGIAGES
jgi:agmatinase